MLVGGYTPLKPLVLSRAYFRSYITTIISRLYFICDFLNSCNLLIKHSNNFFFNFKSRNKKNAQKSYAVRELTEISEPELAKTCNCGIKNPIKYHRSNGPFFCSSTLSSLLKIKHGSFPCTSKQLPTIPNKLF